MSTCMVVGAMPSLEQQTRSPPLAQSPTTATAIALMGSRRHRRRSSHHLLQGLPTRPVSTAPYLRHHPQHLTHRPRPATPDSAGVFDAQLAIQRMEQSANALADTSTDRRSLSGTMVRSQSVRRMQDADGRTAVLRPLNILAPRPKKASVSGQPALHLHEAPLLGRRLARPLSFCFGEDLAIDAADAATARQYDRMATLQQEIASMREEQLRQAAGSEAEAEAEAEGMAPVVVDLTTVSTLSGDCAILDDVAHATSMQSRDERTVRQLHVAIPAPTLVPSTAVSALATGDSAAAAEIFDIFSYPAVSPVDSVSSSESECLLHAPSAGQELDLVRSVGGDQLSVAIPSMSPTAAAALEAAFTGQAVAMDVEYTDVTRPPPQQQPQPPMRTGKSKSISLRISTDGPAGSEMPVISTEFPPVLPQGTGSQETLAGGTVLSLTRIQPTVHNDSAEPADIGLSPIIRTTNPVPLDWSFAATPRLPKQPMAHSAVSDLPVVDDDDDSDLLQMQQTLDGTCEISNRPMAGDYEPMQLLVIDAARTAAATSGFLNSEAARPGRSHDLLDNISASSGPAPVSMTAEQNPASMPAGYQRPRSFSVSVANDRPAILGRLGIRRH